MMTITSREYFIDWLFNDILLIYTYARLAEYLKVKLWWLLVKVDAEMDTVNCNQGILDEQANQLTRH